MNFLAIDTTTDRFSISITKGKGKIFSRNIEGKKHSDKLIDEIDKMLLSAAICADDIDAIAAGIGPGSFTGIRVGLSFAFTFSQIQKIPVYGFSALSLASENIKFPVIKAYRDKYYSLNYSEDLEALAGFKIIDEEERINIGGNIIDVDSSCYINKMESEYDKNDRENWKNIEPIYIMETVYKAKKSVIERIK